MGRVSVEFDIANREDVLAAKLGVLPSTSVRKTRLSGVVDTGATRLVLPENVVSALGLPVVGTAFCRLADGSRIERKIAGEAEVEILGRSGVFKAVVEPRRTDALIGVIVLEDLDFVVDPSAQKLVPRDPRGIITEME
jgi:predicted aspartyl protease